MNPPPSYNPHLTYNMCWHSFPYGRYTQACYYEIGKDARKYIKGNMTDREHKPTILAIEHDPNQ